MKKNPKTKMCWNCEGNVSVLAESCRYCGVSVVPASLDFEKTLPPLYQEEESIKIQESNEEEAVQESKVDSEAEAESSLEGFKNSLLAISSLLGGSVLFLFGLTLLLFSDQNFFVLKWDTHLWFLYSGLAVPLLFIGWRSLQKLEEE